MTKAADRKRITIIPAIHGKLTYDRKISEPDVAWIIEKCLERHPEINNRQGRIRAVSGQWTTEDGLKTEVITVTMVADDDIAGYAPERDADLYEYWKAEARYSDRLLAVCDIAFGRRGWSCLPVAKPRLNRINANRRYESSRP